VKELGFTSEEVGLHSLHSGAAMAMCLAKIPLFIIMLIGHWSSDAFLLYIWKQVQEFGYSVSHGMIQRGGYFTIPTTSDANPWQASNQHNLVQNHVGCGAQAAAIQPQFAIWT